MASTHTFTAAERLKSHVTIGRLFREGQSFGVYPLRVIWVSVEGAEGAYPAQFALSVPKRNFKRAVDRNRLRRKVREAYRLQKRTFYEQLPQVASTSSQYALMVIYTAKEAHNYAKIQRAMGHLLQRLAKKINVEAEKSSL